MELLAIALLGLAAYLVGSITPAYYLVHFIKGGDIRDVGSRNVGTLNTFHQLGPWWSLLVLLFDAGKGAVAVLLPGWVGVPDWAVYVTGFLVVVGHNWPALLKFRGGKGAATLIGVGLALAPAAGMIAAIPGIAVIFLSRNAIVGLTVGFITFNLLVIAAWVFGIGWLAQDAGWEPIALFLPLTIFVAVVYGIAVRRQLVEAVRQRSLRAAFYGS